MSTRENIRLIARTPLRTLTEDKFMFNMHKQIPGGFIRLKFGLGLNLLIYFVFKQ